jgi:altronate dehydratase small subunit
MSKRIEQPVADAVILDAADHVATALRTLFAGETVRVGGPGRLSTIIAAEAVPLCHKIAVKAVKPGGAVFKYGEFIGDATRAIEPGEHVHIHNIKGRGVK